MENIIEVARASGDTVEFADNREMYNRFFEEHREGCFIEVESMDELHKMMPIDYVVRTSNYKFDGESTGSAFEGVDIKVILYDGYIE